MSDITIQTKTISIKVIQVGGHKMTKATFRQIPYEGLFNLTTFKLIIEKGTILGWVYDNDDKYFVYEWQGILEKCKVTEYRGTECLLPELKIPERRTDRIWSNAVNNYVYQTDEEYQKLVNETIDKNKEIQLENKEIEKKNVIRLELEKFCDDYIKTLSQLYIAT